jgi:hypothetical protein
MTMADLMERATGLDLDGDSTVGSDILARVVSMECPDLWSTSVETVESWIVHEDDIDTGGGSAAAKKTKFSSLPGISKYGTS